MNDDELTRFLDSLPARPRLLGLGEPTHGEDEFLRVRNRIFRRLVEHEGYRSIAIESDCLAGLVVETFVAGGPGPVEDVMAAGFSHGFGASQANRDLVEWMRQENENRAPGDRLRFDGFDGPMETAGAASPRRSLTALSDYLGTRDAAQIEQLAGDDDRWSDPAAMWNPARSIGDTEEARTLRRIADDLTARLDTETPGLIAATSREAWEQARLHARTATGLLRHHAVMATPSPSRFGRLSAQRDAMMAANLRAIADREARRGPTLVFAHNLHLQKVGSTMQFGPESLLWWSAGAITAATAGDTYAFVATALGSAPSLGLDTPAPDTLEGVLATREALLTADEVRAALDGHDVVPRTVTDQRYFPLDPGHLGGADGVLVLPRV